MSLDMCQYENKGDAETDDDDASGRHRSISMAMKATAAMPISAGTMAAVISAGVRLSDGAVPVAVDGASVWGDMAVTSDE